MDLDIVKEDLEYKEFLAQNVASSWVFQSYCILTEILIYGYFAVDRVFGFWPLCLGLFLSVSFIAGFNFIIKNLVRIPYIQIPVALFYFLLGFSSQLIAGLVLKFIPEDNSPYAYYQVAISMYLMRVMCAIPLIWLVTSNLRSNW